MLISVRQLLDRTRHPASKAADLAKLRARWRVQPGARDVSADVRRLAERLRSLRREMFEAIGEVSACGGCAKGHPAPAGRWDGGHCCGGGTFRVFTPEEVAALKLGGTRLRDWRAPRGDHAGCAFRGPTGCSLEPEHRPTICVRYVCLELRAELREAPRWRRIGALGRKLERCQRELRDALQDDFS